jgi:hypothetical protein
LMQVVKPAFDYSQATFVRYSTVEP